jgi:hypothetical protein
MIERINQRGALSATALQERLKSSDFEREHADKHCDVVIDATQPLETVVETFITEVNALLE